MHKGPIAAEPSRWGPGEPGHYPSMSTHKMRFVASRGMGELNAQIAEASRLFRLDEEGARIAPHVVTIEDVTKGIVGSYADQQSIQRLVLDTNAEYTKGGTVRLTHAVGRFISCLRSYKHIDSDTRSELTRRAQAYWKKVAPVGYDRQPTVRKSEERAGRGRHGALVGRAEKSLRFTIPSGLMKSAGAPPAPGRAQDWSDYVRTRGR